jgi:hypothetical protein
MAKIQCEAWIGDISYMENTPSFESMIFDTRDAARRAGWKRPHRVTIVAFTKSKSGETK